MEISTSTECACNRMKTAEAMRMLKDAGFSYVDYGTPCVAYQPFQGIFAAGDAEFRAFFEQEYACMKQAGIRAGQTHAPFPTWTNDRSEQEFMLRAIERSAEATAIIKSPYMVIHPAMPDEWSPDTDPERTKKVNYEFLCRLLDAAHKHNIKLALENMPGHSVPCCTVEELIEYIDMMHDDALCACLDTGHANMAGFSCADFAESLGGRLKVLHVHDNNGMLDQHLVPYIGTVDWERFLRSLKKIGYSGTFSFEATNSESVPAGLLPAAENYLWEIGRYFMARYEAAGL